MKFHGFKSSIILTEITIKHVICDN